MKNSEVFKRYLIFHSQNRHIYPLYCNRSQKDAPFYFPPEVISPSCLRHPFPFYQIDKEVFQKYHPNFILHKYSPYQINTHQKETVLGIGSFFLLANYAEGCYTKQK